MRYSALSSSVMLVRPHLQSDYQLLFLKRAKKTYAGGTFAFPGGKIEAQDLQEKWQSAVPQLFSNMEFASQFHDFNKRVAVIRETFEETQLLLAEKSETSAQSPSL